MLIYVIGIALVGGLTLVPQLASAEVENPSPEMAVIGVALAGDVKDREPVDRVNPSISCETIEETQGALPIVDSNTNGRVFFWNTVQSTGDTTIRHIWKMKRNQSWQPMAKVDLPIGKSQSYRTWSSKKFDRNRHLGEWRIEVARADQPDQVLCHSSFRVE